MRRRVALSLLIAYAATITVVAVGYACRLHVMQRVYTRFIFGRPSGLPVESFEDIQTSTGIGLNMTDEAGSIIIILANINPIQIAAVAGLTLLGGLIITAMRRHAAKLTAPLHPQD